jgi:hypothetical protein
VNPRIFLAFTFVISAVALIAHAQTLSPDGSSITPSSGGSLVTADGTWTFGTATQPWGTQVELNGLELSGIFASELIVFGGKMYAQYGGTSPGWSVYENGGWTATNDPTQSATSSCTGSLTDYYTSSVATPTGYGASYDLFSSQHELEVSVQNCPNNALTLTVGSNQSNQYIYNKGYVYQSGSWQSINLTGTGLVSNAWYPQIASAILSVTPTSWTYVVGYVCSWNGQLWQCGCANTSCATNYWQLQAFENSQTASSGANGGPDNRVACNYYVAPSGGNDSNPGTSAQPFATLTKLQSALQAAASENKVGCLKTGSGGSYNNAALTFTSADAGEYWECDPASAIDSCVLDGSGSTATALFLSDNADNITINGLKIQNYTTYSILVGGYTYGADGATVENNDIGSMNIPPPVEMAGNIAGTMVSRSKNVTIQHNYYHDITSGCMGATAYQPGDSLDGLVETGNVLVRCATASSDDGAAGLSMHANNINGGHVTISDNVILDWGNAGYDSLRGIYLDDDSSNVTVTGNIIGPPAASFSGAFFQPILVNGGCCNLISNNIFDLGFSSREYIADFTYPPSAGGSIDFTWSAPNIVQDNVIVSNYAGQTNTNDSGGGHAGVEYVQGSGAMPSNLMTIQGNTYHNYGGGAETTAGNQYGDTNPIHADPGCHGYLYALSNPPSGWTAIKSGWGPPGFVIPSSTNHSCPD